MKNLYTYLFISDKKIKNLKLYGLDNKLIDGSKTLLTGAKNIKDSNLVLLREKLLKLFKKQNK
jgi:hypothetical protein